MTSEEKDRFKTKFEDTALSSFKPFSEYCKFENILSVEEINLLKALMRNKNIIRKGDKSKATVIFDRERYTEGEKSAISNSNNLSN